MNIGLVTTWFERGGAYVSRQYRQALEGDHAVFVYARGGEAYAQKDGRWNDSRVTWGKRSLLPVTTAIDYKDYRLWLERNRIDLVIFNEQQWWEPVLWTRELGVTVAAYIDYYTEATIPLFGCYDLLLCNTRRHQSVFSWHPQCFYIPWGTDTSVFKPKGFGPVDEKSLVFFHSAGMSPHRKGTDLLLEAFARLSGDVRLVIHTQVDLAEKLPELAPLIRNLQADRRLKVHEGTVGAPGLYCEGDVYVYPSRLDGVGLTIGEALASGLPVITTDNPPMNEFVNEQVGRLVRVARFYSRADGYYWPQCQVDVADLTEKMKFFLEQREALVRFKKAARAEAETNLDWSRNSRGLADVVRQASRLSSTQTASAVLSLERYYNARNSLKILRLMQRHPRALRFFLGIWQLIQRTGSVSRHG